VKRGPWGVAGGKEGQPLKVTINPNTDREWEFRREDNGKALPAGTIVRIETAGGGGYGTPAAIPSTTEAPSTTGGTH